MIEGGPDRMFVNSAEEFLHDPTFHDRGSQDSLLHSDESSSHSSAIHVTLDDVRLPHNSAGKVNYTHHLDGVGSTESRWETDTNSQLTEVILPSTLPSLPPTNFDDFDFDFTGFDNASPDSNNYLQFDNDMLGIEVDYLTNISEPFISDSSL
jgi:hypothetical protein